MLMNKLELIVFVWLILLMASNLLKTNKVKNQREKQSTFECGFEPEHKTRSAFSLRFFVITIVFLIFDVEITILLPLPFQSTQLNYKMNVFINTMMVTMLLMGLLFEWSQGALEWSWKNI